MKTPSTPQSYAAGRETLLRQIAAGLEADARIAAAWLAGSYGRGEQDAFSDLDLFVVLPDRLAEAFCAYVSPTAGSSPPERLALFAQFGAPVNIHENHHNAPEGGTFTSVMYADPPVIVDWTILPAAQARRPAGTRLLFDRVGVPVLSPAGPPALTGAARRQKIDERVAFFWMMAAVTAKYIRRGSALPVNDLLAFIASELRPLEDLLGVSPEDPPDVLYSGQAAQAARLRVLMARVESLGMDSAPKQVVEVILRLD